MSSIPRRKAIRSVRQPSHWLLTLLCLLAPWRAASVQAAHKFHLSFTQIEYNAKAQTAEIIIRVFADDLEAALSQRAGKSVKLDHKDAAALAAAYVHDLFEIKAKDGKLRKLTWVGMELQNDTAQLYIEAKLPTGLGEAQLRALILCEIFADQVNQVHAKSPLGNADLVFRGGDGFKTIGSQMAPAK